MIKILLAQIMFALLVGCTSALEKTPRDLNWEKTLKANTIKEYENYLQRWPDAAHEYKQKANQRIAILKEAEAKRAAERARREEERLSRKTAVLEEIQLLVKNWKLARAASVLEAIASKMFYARFKGDEVREILGTPDSEGVEIGRISTLDGIASYASAMFRYCMRYSAADQQDFECAFSYIAPLRGEQPTRLWAISCRDGNIVSSVQIGLRVSGKNWRYDYLGETSVSIRTEPSDAPCEQPES